MFVPTVKVFVSSASFLVMYNLNFKKSCKAVWGKKGINNLQTNCVYQHHFHSVSEPMYVFEKVGNLGPTVLVKN